MWPTRVLDSDIADDPEVKRNFAVNAVVTEEVSSATHKLITHFSRWKRLKSAVGWILKLKEILLALSKKRKELITANTSGDGRHLADADLEMQKLKARFGEQRLSVDDLHEAETSIVRFSQWERFHNEIVALASGKSKVKRESTIYKLDPIYDRALLRVGGWLNKSPMHEDTKHLLILTKDQYISTLILRHIHDQLSHGGRNLI